MCRLNGIPGLGEVLERDVALARILAWTWSHQRIVLIAIDKITMYLRERCWLQVGVGVEDFVVPHPPLRVIDIEGEAGRGEIGIDALVFLDWGRDYREWWATQSCGPLGGPIEPQVSLFYFFAKLFVIFHSFCLKTFDDGLTCLILSGSRGPTTDEPVPPTRRGRKRKAHMVELDLVGVILEVVTVTDLKGRVSEEPLLDVELPRE